MVSCIILLSLLSAFSNAKPIALGLARTYGVLSGSAGATNTGLTSIVGNIGTTGVSITGFPPGKLTGTKHVGDSAAIAAFTASQLAYASAINQTSTRTMATPDLTGMTLYPGVYTFPTTATLTGALRLAGNASSDGIFVFKIGSALFINGGSQILLQNGASACNVYWQVGSSAVLSVGVKFVGSILAYQGVAVKTGASVVGGLYSGAASITLDSNSITVPVCR